MFDLEGLIMFNFMPLKCLKFIFQLVGFFFGRVTKYTFTTNGLCQFFSVIISLNDCLRTTNRLPTANHCCMSSLFMHVRL